MRDHVDLQDAIEAFVPFAKRFSWATRRIAGLASCTVGSLALSICDMGTGRRRDERMVIKEAEAKAKSVNQGMSFDWIFASHQRRKCATTLGTWLPV